MFIALQALGMERHVGKQIAGGFELLLGLLLLRRDRCRCLPGGAPTSGARSAKTRCCDTSLAVRNSGFLVSSIRMSPVRSLSPTCHLVLTNFHRPGSRSSLPLMLVGRRRRSGNAQQRIDLRQVRPGEREIGVGAGPLEGILHGALQGELGRADRSTLRSIG